MRIITRGDFDGLAAAVLVSAMEEVSGIAFAHPKDMQEGKVEVREDDIILNLPYHPNCAMWFDHHLSQEEVAKTSGKFKGRFRVAPSAARVVYEYYNSDRLKRFDHLVAETDRVDSAQLEPEDVSRPTGWVLISYTIDPRSGFGRYQDYFNNMVKWIQEYSLEEILEIPEVKEKCAQFLAEQEKFGALLKKHSRLDGNVIITDLRELDRTPIGNRFLIYTLFPDGNISFRIFKGRNNDLVAALGHNIFNRTCKTDVGILLGEYSGGGHKGAGTVQFPIEVADEKFREIIEKLKRKG